MPYIAWMTTTAAQCEQRAMSATAAAGAFETAFAGVIPPEMIAENRIRLATLIATNFMGINSAAIAEAEAEYSEYWAQDASTLYGFAGEAAAITNAMLPALPAVPDANPAGIAAQAAAVGESAGQSAGQAGAQVSAPSAGCPDAVRHGLGDEHGGHGPADSLLGPAGATGAGESVADARPVRRPVPVVSGAVDEHGHHDERRGLGDGPLGLLGSLGSLGSFTPGTTPVGSGGFVTASLGRATTLTGAGPRLSVPSSWAESVKAARPTVALLAADGEAETTVAGAPRAGVIPPGGMGVGGSGNSVTTTGYREGDRPRALAPHRVTEQLVF